MKLIALFLLIFSTSSFAESFHCQGDLTVYEYNGKTAQLISKDNAKDFVFKSDAALALAFGISPTEPLVKVYPWNGIDWVDISKRVPGGAAAKPTVSTDGRTWFTVQAQNSAHKTQQTTCEYRRDD